MVDEAKKQGVQLDELSFITTRPIQSEEITQKIQLLSTQTHTVVFTSMNAVEAVAAQISQAPNWQMYSIGNTTRNLIEEKWGSERLIATADNAQQLGQRLIDDGVRNVVFFCGNIRRDELPNKIRSEGGTMEEVVVYETEELPEKLTKDYDGILFFSPSAVQAFYQQNQPAKHTMLFAIGKTTAEALRQHKARNIVVGDKTDKVELALLAIDTLNHSDTRSQRSTE